MLKFSGGQNALEIGIAFWRLKKKVLFIQILKKELEFFRPRRRGKKDILAEKILWQYKRKRNMGNVG